jgi:uncharacterized protein YqeY
MLRDRINEALKDAMRAKDPRKVSALRLVNAAIKDKDIAARTRGDGSPLKDDEILSLMQSMVKQRRESVALYRQGGRADLVEQEEGEIAVIESFLPQQMDEAAMEAAVRALIAEAGAASVKDMGKVMALLKQRFAGQMDPAKASGLVKSLLS